MLRAAGADPRLMGYGFAPPEDKTRPKYVLRNSLRIHPHGCDLTAGVTRHLPGWYNPRRHKSHA